MINSNTFSSSAIDDDAVKKAKVYEKNREPLEEVWIYLTAFFRLLKAYIRKDYRDITLVSMVLVISAIIYFVMSIDLIPDILPGGFIDDVTVIGFVVKTDKGRFGQLSGLGSRKS
ncbi:MAG: DUF1232 domain-containing protein [Anaerolineaceae bacterium]